METNGSLAADREFFRALVSREFTNLEQILADDFVLIDLSGAVIPKAAFLNSLRSGDLHFEAIQPEDISVHVYGYTALIRGRTAMQGSFKGSPFEFNSRYTHTYFEQAGGWRMVAAQGTMIAE
ncbi:MAG TPA: nuclear transport factor 2 family protein [Terriglobia bacterium]|nr:nuclear transport factor 2 family protein [Terriglobia bacterium]